MGLTWLQETDVDIFGFRNAHFQNAGDFLGLPVDDTGHQQRQAATGVHLLVQFARVDSSSPPVIDIPRQCMNLLALEKPTPDACAEPWLGQVAEQEFGLEDTAQVPVGAVGVILGCARGEALQGYRRSRVPAFQ